MHPSLYILGTSAQQSGKSGNPTSSSDRRELEDLEMASDLLEISRRVHWLGAQTRSLDSSCAFHLSLGQGGEVATPCAGFEPVSLRINYRHIFNHIGYQEAGPLAQKLREREAAHAPPVCSLAQHWSCEFPGAAPTPFPPEKLQTFSLVRKASLGFSSWIDDGLGKRSFLVWHALSLGRVKNCLVGTRGSINPVREPTNPERS